MTTAANPPAPARADFADWLSPILVKELRQGLRTRVFTVTFSLLQFVLATSVLIGLLVAANGADTSGVSGVFWAIVAVPVLLVVPWAGLNAVSGESRAHTLELIFLTPLTALRILLGKWIAIFAQSALLLAAVLPYVVLRYFMGGVDLAAELLVVGLLLAASALLSAVLVGLSAYPGRVMRVLVVLAMVLAAQTFLPILVFAQFGGAFGATGASWPPAPVIIGYVALAFLAGLLALEFGAARIAPAAENHSARKRLLALAAWLLAAVGRAFSPEAAPLAILALALTVPVLVGSLCEEVRGIPSLYRPFARRGFAGRALGRLLYPGWPSGFAFTGLALGLYAGLFATYGFSTEWWYPLAYLSFCGALLVPAALVRLFLPLTNRPLVWFIGIQTVAIVVTTAVRIVDSVTGNQVSHLLAFFPTSALLVTATGGIDPGEASLALLLVVVTLTLAVVILLVRAVPSFREISARERAALHDRVA